MDAITSVGSVMILDSVRQSMIKNSLMVISFQFFLLKYKELILNIENRDAFYMFVEHVHNSVVHIPY
jgi:hypothetical protein